MKIFLILGFMILLSLPCLAQENIETSSEVLEGKVNINYILNGDPSKDYEVTIVLKRTSQPDFHYIPNTLKGDLGTGKYATGMKTISWLLTKDEEQIFSHGDDFYFEVTAKVAGTGSNWLYYVGGAALLGGAAAVLLRGNGGSAAQNTASTTQNLPTPPARP